MMPVAFALRPRFDWQLRTRTFSLGERTRLMAIVNLTPDSFSGDGWAQGRGTDQDIDAAVQAACRAIDGGADIIDLGAESTRPNATPLDAVAEQARLLPVLAEVRRARSHAVISVDTYHAATARAAAALGAEIVNDVSGLTWDPAMAQAVAETGCGLVLMHTRGRPGDWRMQPTLPREALRQHVLEGLSLGLTRAASAGMETEAIVLDPGFGFGKQGTENFALLADLPLLQALGRPLLVGLSRKGFLGDAVRSVQPLSVPALTTALARRDATLAGNVAAVLAGAHLLRVHDLQAAREAAAVADAVLAAEAMTQGLHRRDVMDCIV